MSTVVQKKTHAFEQAKKAGVEPFKVADLSLAEFGRKEIRLAEHEMPGLMSIREKYRAERPLAGRARRGQRARVAQRLAHRVANGVARHLGLEDLVTGCHADTIAHGADEPRA